MSSIYDRPKGKKRSRPSAGEVTDLPMVTILVIVACIAFFWAYHQRSPDDLPNEFEKIWEQNPFEIWNGGYWALVTMTTVHEAFFHIAFNVYWLWIFGASMERAIGSAKFFAFFVGAAFVSSSWQLSLDGPGIGASGVNYALFGYMWITRFHYTPFLDIITERTSRLLFGWLFICIVLDFANIMPIGNVAHFSGFIFGAGVGGIAILRYKLAITIPAFFLFVGGSILTLFWAPWSFNWSLYKAHQEIEAGHLQEGMKHLNRAMKRKSDSGIEEPVEE